MALNRAQVALNLIRTMGSDVYKNTVPALTESTPIETIWNVFTEQTMVYKEFTQLFGAFLELEVMRDSWSNVLKELITSGTPLGEFSAVVGANPANPHKYDPNHPERVLEYAMSDDKVIYYARNIKEFFKVSFPYEDIKGAFRSYEDFDEYMSMKLATLESGKQISSYNHIMESLVINYFSGVFVESDVHISKDTNNYEDWLTAVKNAYEEMQFPSIDYNNYGKLEGANGDFKGWSKPEDIYILARIDWINKVDVSFLASIFNLDKAEIGKRIRKIPSFSYDTYDDEGNYLSTIESPIQAIVIDRRAFKFKNDLDLDTSNFNEQTLVSNYWKHFWATYQINPMAQALVFTAPEGMHTDQNTNFYNVVYNQPSTTIIKNKTDDTLNMNISYDVEPRNLIGSNGTACTWTITNPDIPETADYVFRINELDRAVGNILFYSLMHLFMVNSTELEKTSFYDLYQHPEYIISQLGGDDVFFTLTRETPENLLRTGKFILVEGDESQEIPEYSFIITDEVLTAIKNKFGDNIFFKLKFKSDEEINFEDINITFDYANKI